MRVPVFMLNTVLSVSMLSISYSLEAQAAQFNRGTSSLEREENFLKPEPSGLLSRSQDDEPANHYDWNLPTVIQDFKAAFWEINVRDRLANYIQNYRETDNFEVTLQLNPQDTQTPALTVQQSRYSSLFADPNFDPRRFGVPNSSRTTSLRMNTTEVAPGGSRNWLDTAESRYW